MLVDHSQETKKESKNLKKQEIHDIYLSKRTKQSLFPHKLAYGGFEDFNRRTVPDKILLVKAFNFAKNPKYDGNQCRITSMM